MAKLPEPPRPADLAARTVPDVHTLEAGTILWRITFREGPHATTWNRFRTFGPVASGRCDHHAPPPRDQSRGVLYAAIAGPTCVAEVFQDTRVVHRHRRAPWLAAFALEAPVALLDLTGGGPTRAHASAALSSGPRPRAIHAAYPTLAGLYYPSTIDANRPALALTERARGALPAHPLLNRALAEPPLLAPIANAAARFGYRVV